MPSTARDREAESSARNFIPETKSLKVLAEAVQACRGCRLYENATQAVFGEGLKKSRVVMVGEVPGDQEDRQGKPFVGGAGRLLDQCLNAAGIDRKLVYVTNAVKHFKFEPKGKRRLHKKPSAREIEACRPWLERELELIGPEAIVCLGATAAQAVIGPHVRITRQRGEWLESRWSANTLVTYHPAAILRAPTEKDRRQLQEILIGDLSIVRDRLNPPSD